MQPQRAPRSRRFTAALLAPASAPPIAMATLYLAAVAVGLAGYLHGHLFHEGYAHVKVVGALFVLNVLGSGVVVTFLLMRRLALFALGAFSISLGAAVSIIISHTTSFFGFAEHRPALRGEALFSSHGCADCHTIAAGSYDGQLGPRLDGTPLPAAAVVALIGNPPRSIPGFEPGLMPENFDQRLPAGDIKDIAAFVAVASKAAG